MENVEFFVNKQKLKGVIFYPQIKKDKNPAILFVHGWTSMKERSFQYAQALSKLGFLCFLFDMRGHGQSEGDIKTFTIKDFSDDVIAAYDYLSEVKSVNKENISAVASSFGCYLIALLSQKRKIKNLVMRAPADYANEEFNRPKSLTSGDEPEVMAWRKKIKQPNETYALEAINNFSGNILIIEAELDDTIPHETIENYANAVKDKNKLTHIVLKGAPHSIAEGKFRDQITQILVNWFKGTRK